MVLLLGMPPIGSSGRQTKVFLLDGVRLAVVAGGSSAIDSSCWRLLVAAVLGPDASFVVDDKERERLLDEDAAVLSVASAPLRRANSVWKDAMDDRRRRELR